MKKCGSSGTGDPSLREERRERKTEIRRKEERPAGVSGMDTRIGSVRFEDEDD